MAKDLYLMRHGETLFNVRRKIQGWIDSPLTQNGIKQAHAAGALLHERGVRIDHAYCSTAERASDTLEIVLAEMEQNLTYERLKNIRERGFGMFEGESEDLNPPREHYDDLFPHYGGETSFEVQERMVATLTDIMKPADTQCVLAVSHGGASVLFTSRFVDTTTIFKGRLPNCAILHFAFDNGQFTFVEMLNA